MRPRHSHPRARAAAPACLPAIRGHRHAVPRFWLGRGLRHSHAQARTLLSPCPRPALWTPHQRCTGPRLLGSGRMGGQRFGNELSPHQRGPVTSGVKETPGQACYRPPNGQGWRRSDSLRSLLRLCPEQRPPVGLVGPPSPAHLWACKEARFSLRARTPPLPSQGSRWDLHSPHLATCPQLL